MTNTMRNNKIKTKDIIMINLIGFFDKNNILLFLYDIVCGEATNTDFECSGVISSFSSSNSYHDIYLEKRIFFKSNIFAKT
jgi:hypothetical protein